MDFILCREMGLSPKDLAEMPEHQYRLWVDFLNAEGHAVRMEREKRDFLGS